MKSVLSSENLLAKINHSYAYELNNGFPVSPFRLTSFGFCIRPPRFSVSYKKSAYQDFQEYVKPKRLLPARGLESLGDETPDKLISRLGSDGSQCLYKIGLRTSALYGSGLSDSNAGVLICIIDEHGNSILERIPATLCQDHEQQSAESNDFDHTHFRRGSLDKFVFLGPQLGPLQAMWISLESGNWRLGGASLTTLSISNHQSEHCANGDVQRSVNYKFEVEDVMLGEGSETGMVELRPCQVTECAGVNESEMSDLGPSLAERKRMNEESMKEYADLKVAQLLYDFILILGGTSISAIAGDEKTALSFLVGGSCGFLYLLLLQRSVDNLPSPESTNTTQINKFKDPLLLSAFVFGGAIILLLVKHGTPPGLAPTDILIGMLGFLASKLAVVLSALKPMPLRMEDNK
ncbi:uncharacterized protein LOC141619516 [Silene latifolia]|uniref:uncharacterized protein LOC141619516 n=1 Tax=Silene latifolia TaxID=37657 RepID=UPI003D76CD34